MQSETHRGWKLIEIPPWWEIALSELGTHEIAGHRDNPRILEYFKATTLGTAVQGDETAWCSAFECWCMEQTGRKSPHRANARSWLNWGVELSEPRFGCVVVYWRGERHGPHGHVNFYSGQHTGDVIGLGGNQHNEVSLARYPQSRVLSYRWPEGEV